MKSFLLGDGGLDATLSQLQQGKPFQDRVYGDERYPVCSESHINRGFRGAILTPAQNVSRDVTNPRFCGVGLRADHKVDSPCRLKKTISSSYSLL